MIRTPRSPVLLPRTLYVLVSMALTDDDDSADSGDEEANAASMMDLNTLAETDPEFYDFLKVIACFLFFVNPLCSAPLGPYVVIIHG